MFLSSVMVRRVCFERVGCFDPAIPALEDWDLYLRIARSYEIETIQEPLTTYRLHASNSPHGEHVEGRIKTALKHLNDLETSDPSSGKARHNLQVHLGTAHYMAGDFRACRRWTMKAFRTRPLATAKSRLPLHMLLSFLPGGVLHKLRETRGSGS
jgi:hypothetical protein